MADKQVDLVTHGLQLIQDGTNVMHKLNTFLPQLSNNVFVGAELATVFVIMVFVIIFLSFLSAGVAAATNAASASYTHNSTEETRGNDEKNAEKCFIQGQIISSCCYFSIVFVYVCGGYGMYNVSKRLQFNKPASTQLLPKPSTAKSSMKRGAASLVKNITSARESFQPHNQL